MTILHNIIIPDSYNIGERRPCGFIWPMSAAASTDTDETTNKFRASLSATEPEKNTEEKQNTTQYDDNEKRQTKRRGGDEKKYRKRRPTDVRWNF